jgi:hypothetical protein
MGHLLSYAALAIFFVIYVAVVLGTTWFVAWFLAWFLTPVVFKRWREMQQRYPREG